jgi:hypothetical protein
MNDFDNFLHQTIACDHVELQPDTGIKARLLTLFTYQSARYKVHLNHLLPKMRGKNGVVWTILRWGVAGLVLTLFFNLKQVHPGDMNIKTADTLNIDYTSDTNLISSLCTKIPFFY